MNEFKTAAMCHADGCHEFVIHAHARYCWSHELLHAASRVVESYQRIESHIVTREDLGMA